MSQRVLSVLVVIIELGRLLPTESATMVLLLSGFLPYDTSRVIGQKLFGN